MTSTSLSRRSRSDDHVQSDIAALPCRKQPSQTAAARSAPIPQLPSLTPLRGVAALWVVFYHLAWNSLPQQNDAFTLLLRKGYLAVDFFFLLSGFVLAHVYWREFSDRVQPRSYLTFFKARVARLYPLHLTMLGAFVALALLFLALRLPGQSVGLWGNHSLTAFLANLFMLQGLNAAQLSWDYPTWSISLEFLAYLGLPLVLALVFKARREWKLVAALVLAGIPLALAATHQGSLNHWLGPVAVLRCIPEFLLGVLIYDVWQNSAKHSSAAIILAAGVGIVCALEFGLPDPVAVALFALIIPLSVSLKGRTADLMNWRGFIWLGEISYALYLTHAVVQYLFLTTLSAAGFGEQQDFSTGLAIAVIASAVLISLLLADLAHRYIEIPAQKALRSRKPSPIPTKSSPDWALRRQGPLQPARQSYPRS